MKKLTLVLVVLLVSLSVFAGQRTELILKPFEAGVFNDPVTDEKSNSKYGLGGAVSLIYTLDGTIYGVGGELSADTFFFDDSNYFNVSLQGKVGVDSEIGEVDNAFFYAKVGAVAKFHGTYMEVRPLIGAQAGITRELNDNTSLTFGIEGEYAVPGLSFGLNVGIKHEL